MLKRFSAVLLITLALTVLWALTLEARGDGRLFTPEDLWAMKRVGSLSLSLDGRMGAVTVTEYDIEENKGNGDIWIFSTDGELIRRFTTGKTSESYPTWSPDGGSIAFLSKRDDDEYEQLYVIPTDGGEARSVTDMPLGVSHPRWLPDGKRIVFVSRVIPEFESDLDSLKAEVKRRKESKVTAKLIENRFYRHWDHWLTDGYYPHFYLLDLETEEVTDLTPGYLQYFNAGWDADYDVAPDGTEIAFSAIRQPAPFDSVATDVYVLRIDSPGDIRNITPENPADDFSPHYSPSGEFLLYGRREMADFYADRVRLIRYDRSTGERVEITEGYDRSPQGWKFSPDGRKVYFTAQDRGKTSIFSTSIKGGQIKEVFRGGTNSGLEVAGKNKLVFLHQDLSHPDEVYCIEPSGKDLQKLTSFNDEVLSEIEMGVVEELTFAGSEGREVQMYLIHPPGFHHSKKWPLLHLVHGGPHGIFGDYFNYRWNAQLFAAPGYVTAMVNFHGSSSFGQEFTDAISGAWGDKPFTDIMKATDFLLSTGIIDEDRMAVAGGSYGGYLVSWIGTQTNRFACIINHAGVFDFVSQFGMDYTQGCVRTFGGSPWENLEGLNAYNPSHHMEGYETPTLIIHGEKDYRVPVGNGLTAYGILKAKGVDAKLVYFPDENHFVLTAQNSIFWYNELHGWLDRHIGDGSAR